MSSYSIPAAAASAEVEVKRSRFLATVRPIRDMEQMKAFIKEMREAHPKASHNCWALISGAPTDSNTFGFSDDGEPNGTAGKPIFMVLQHSGLGQTGIVVTRYFGGTKLGTGGLVKSYTEAAKLGIEATERIEYSPMKVLTITLPYSQEPHLRHLLEQTGLHTTQFQYNEDVTASCPIREDEVDSVLALLKEQLGHDVDIQLT